MRVLIVAFLMALGLAGFARAGDFPGEPYYVCDLDPNGDNFLALRTCGSTSCQMTQKLGPGTYVLAVEAFMVRGWREVVVMRHAEDYSFGGPRGWVHGNYICAVFE